MMFYMYIEYYEDKDDKVNIKIPSKAEAKLANIQKYLMCLISIINRNYSPEQLQVWLHFKAACILCYLMLITL